ncbi:anti-sigma-D factor RsdA [Mycobacterium sp. AMU20-3851]|uniref:anti-sigma-D factor RsdA n=1 Tax=Mycobacterium sp. AMU20-3851 TaxID=3122055 RepID=UPI0037543E9F
MPDFGRWTANGGDPSLNDINRADKFLDALAAEQAPFATDRGDADLAFLLSGWRDEVRHVPMDHILTPSQAGAALVDATTVRRRPNRLSLAVVGSAAAAVLCLGGFGAAVFAAGPGDGLYGVRSMFFGDERATRDDAVVLAAQTELAQVQQLVEQGQWDQAQDKLAALSSTVQSVDRVEQKQELIEQWNALTYKVVEQNPAATLPPPGEPLPVLPASPLTLLPVPVIEDPATVTTEPADGSATTEPATTEPATTSAETTPPETTSPSETSPSETSPVETSTAPTTTAPTATTQPSTTQPTTTVAPTTTASPTSTAAQTPVTTTAPTTTAPSTTSAAATTTAPRTTTAPPAATTTTTIVQSSASAPPRASAPPASAPAEPSTVQEAPVVEEEPVIEQPTQQRPAETVPPVVTTTTVVVPSDGEE